MKKPMAFLLGAELPNVLEVTHILTRSTNVRLSHSCRNKHSHLRILKNPKQTLKKNESMVFPGFFTKLVRETSQPAATEWNPKLHKWQLLTSEASTQVFKLHKLMEIIQHERPILRSLVPAYRYWGSWEAWNISPGQTSGSMREETRRKWHTYRRPQNHQPGSRPTIIISSLTIIKSPKIGKQPLFFW